MLSLRLLSAAILIGSSLTLIGLDVFFPIMGQAGVWVLPMYFAFTLGTAWELSQLLSRKWDVKPSHVVVHCLIACLVCMFPLWYSLVMSRPYPLDCPIGRIGWLLLGILSGVGSSGIAALFAFGDASKIGHAASTVHTTETPSENVGGGAEAIPVTRVEDVPAKIERTTLAWFLSSFVVVYVVGCLSIWFLVRMHGESRTGMMHLVALLAITKFADTGAYFAGKSFGKTKLVPAISPGKTVEGLVGGVLLSIVVSYVLLRGLLPLLGVTAGESLLGPAILGCLLTLVGLVGDLLESMVKRTVGAKDSGVLLPGLGGVWDVTDSLLPTAIVGYLGIIAKLT
jgi:phosphatidate cytidylyltransferase